MLNSNVSLSLYLSLSVSFYSFKSIFCSSHFCARQFGLTAFSTLSMNHNNNNNNSKHRYVYAGETVLNLPHEIIIWFLRIFFFFCGFKLLFQICHEQMPKLYRSFVLISSVSSISNENEKYVKISEKKKICSNNN